MLSARLGPNLVFCAPGFGLGPDFCLVFGPRLRSIDRLDSNLGQGHGPIFYAMKKMVPYPKFPEA